MLNSPHIQWWRISVDVEQSTDPVVETSADVEQSTDSVVRDMS